MWDGHGEALENDVRERRHEGQSPRKKNKRMSLGLGPGSTNRFPVIDAYTALPHPLFVVNNRHRMISSDASFGIQGGPIGKDASDPPRCSTHQPTNHSLG